MADQRIPAILEPIHCAVKGVRPLVESVALIAEDGSVNQSGIMGSVPWWSFGKTVLAIAALRLVESGRLSLEEEIAGEPFTLAQLLRHEAGLADYGELAAYHRDVDARKCPWPVRHLLEAVNSKHLRFEPGRGWAYSNIGYLKVRELIEHVTGAPIGVALDQLVFAPLGLTTARVATVPADLANVEMGPCDGYHPGWVYHGLVTGSAAEAATVLGSLINGIILRPATVSLMLNGRALPEHRSETFSDPAYGLGLMLNAGSPLDHPIGHRGAGPGSSFAAYALGARVCAVWRGSLENPDLVVDSAFRLLMDQMTNMPAR